jgi:hypothetical protein
MIYLLKYNQRRGRVRKLVIVLIEKEETSTVKSRK